MGGHSIPMVDFLFNPGEAQGDSQDCTKGSPSLTNRKSGEPALEITKNSDLISIMESSQANHLLGPNETFRSPISLPPLKNEVNFVLGNSETDDGSGWALWYLILSPSLCLVPILLISCNVVF